MTYLQKLQFLSILALSASFAPTVYAQSVDNTSSTGDTAYFGVAGVITPEYLGSDDDEFLVLPYLEVNDFKGLDFFGTALTYRLIEAGTGEGIGKWSLRVGPRIAYQRGRDSDDSPTLTGFEDVDGSLPIGGYVRSTLGPVGLSLIHI